MRINFGQYALDRYLQKRTPINQPINQTSASSKKEKHKNVLKQYRPSFVNSGQETMILSDEDQSEKKHNRQKPVQACPQLILIYSLTNKPLTTILSKIISDPTKTTICSFILKNCTNSNQTNLSLLDKINNPQFWQTSLPLLLQLLITNSHQIQSKVIMLPALDSSTSELSRQQILMILTCMFLGVLPAQQNNKKLSFFHLFGIHDSRQSLQQKDLCRLQKLKCIINYLTQMSKMLKQDKFMNEIVVFERIYNSHSNFSDTQSDQFQLQSVQFHQGLIEDHYGEAIMVDFANQIIGGGILNNGSAQQQLLFCAFPQAIISQLLCEKMTDNEAIVIHGMKKFNRCFGYSYQFKFGGNYEEEDEQRRFRSVVVAIDAYNYSGVMGVSMQYAKKFVRRQLHKAIIGFKAIEQLRKMLNLNALCTGRWGCGAYNGDQTLKFCLQWIACSQSGLNMIYLSDSKQVASLKLLVKQMKNCMTADLLSLIDHYNKLVKTAGFIKEYTLMDYFKDQL